MTYLRMRRIISGLICLKVRNELRRYIADSAKKEGVIMSAIFKFIFERLTDPFGLPINSFYEYIILAIIGEISYSVSYRKVGDMYRGELIDGRTAGSFFH